MIQNLSETSNSQDRVVFDNPNDSQRKRSYSVRWIQSVRGLKSVINAWNDLAQNAIHKNVFFEPSVLIPAIRNLIKQPVRILVVESVEGTDQTELHALIPFIKKRIYGLPFSCFEVWRHDQCLDATPLIRNTAGADEIWPVIWRAVRMEGVGLISFDTISADGKFGELLGNSLSENGLPCFPRDQHSRAAFTPEESIETYRKNHVSKGVQKKLRRFERRLNEMGELTIDSSSGKENIDRWIDEFLELESSGWKGRAQSALASHADTRAYFDSVVRNLAMRDSVTFLAVRLDGKPIAMLCDFVRDGFGWAYKTAYSEAFSQCSPGFIAEVHNLAAMHRRGLTRVDSCTSSDNALLNRIWNEQVDFQSLVVALTPSWTGELATWLMRQMQSASRLVKKTKNRDESDSEST